MKRIFLYISLLLIVFSCGDKTSCDAQGAFESDETIVSSEINGRILGFELKEGDVVRKGDCIAVIDSLQLGLQRRQLCAQLEALKSSVPDKESQTAALRTQLSASEREFQRIRKMHADGAATQKQMDDASAQVNILKGQISSAIASMEKNEEAARHNAAALQAQIELLSSRIEKCRMVSPVDGIVLSKYANAGELASIGKPVVKIADMDNVYLRAYLTSDQLASVKLGDSVKVTAVFSSDRSFDYEGKVVWIASESEFTPKIIQTRDTRANLVYAVRVAVKNDGNIKLGLAGELYL